MRLDVSTIDSEHPNTRELGTLEKSLPNIHLSCVVGYLTEDLGLRGPREKDLATSMSMGMPLKLYYCIGISSTCVRLSREYVESFMGLHSTLEKTTTLPHSWSRWSVGYTDCNLNRLVQ